MNWFVVSVLTIYYIVNSRRDYPELWLNPTEHEETKARVQIIKMSKEKKQSQKDHDDKQCYAHQLSCTSMTTM